MNWWLFTACSKTCGSLSTSLVAATVNAFPAALAQVSLSLFQLPRLFSPSSMSHSQHSMVRLRGLVRKVALDILRFASSSQPELPNSFATSRTHPLCSLVTEKHFCSLCRIPAPPFALGSCLSQGSNICDPVAPDKPGRHKPGLEKWFRACGGKIRSVPVALMQSLQVSKGSDSSSGQWVTAIIIPPMSAGSQTSAHQDGNGSLAQVG